MGYTNESYERMENWKIMATHEIKRGLKFYLDGGLDKHDLTRIITRVNEKKG